MMSRRFHGFVSGITSAWTMLIFCSASPMSAQSLGNAGTIQGTVVDPSGAAVPSAQISLRNAVTGYNQLVQSGSDGTFKLVNIPPNAYHLEVTAPGFNTFVQEIDIRNSLPVQVRASLPLAGAQTSGDSGRRIRRARDESFRSHRCRSKSAAEDPWLRS